MPTLQIPISNSLTQAINPWNWFLGFEGSQQFGLININLGRSADPALEQTILNEVGTYGRQLGRLGEALEVLLNHVKLENLKPEERKVITAFLHQQDEIAGIKARPRDRPVQG